MMDKNVYSPFNLIPMQSISLRLARATIKMDHGSNWKVDKVNPVHDLIICLTGQGTYRFDDMEHPIDIHPGDAMLIPAYTRFRGTQSGGKQPLTGIAQHFTLDLFGRGDLIQNTRLQRSISLPDWDVLGPMITHYHNTAPFGSTTLSQHHQFMVFLLAYMDAAFLGWQAPQDKLESQDHMSVQIMLAASRLSADPLGGDADEVLSDLPFNRDYFRRAFKQRIGHTPLKFREMKRMEFAASRLGMGVSVKAVAAELGFTDPYYFSRLFKRYLGASPSAYRDASPKGKPS